MPEGNPYDPDWTEQDADNDDYEDDDRWERGEPEDDELDDIEREEEFQSDMGQLLSHYEVEEKEFNAAEAEFSETYGFVHKCRCAKDWEEGNLGVVSVCYLGMVADAMETLATKNEEVRDAKREIARLRIELAGS